jgi:hypothetical protein
MCILVQHFTNKVERRWEVFGICDVLSIGAQSIPDIDEARYVSIDFCHLTVIETYYSGRETFPAREELRRTLRACSAKRCDKGNLRDKMESMIA